MCILHFLRIATNYHPKGCDYIFQSRKRLCLHTVYLFQEGSVELYTHGGTYYMHCRVYRSTHVYWLVPLIICVPTQFSY